VTIARLAATTLRLPPAQALSRGRGGPVAGDGHGTTEDAAQALTTVRPPVAGRGGLGA
jgi:hypothetical protein